jgi:non-homologous end joining protein Ku
VKAKLEEKSKGKEISIDKAPEPKRGQVIDIMEALKRSIEHAPAKKRPVSTVLTKKKKKVS